MTSLSLSLTHTILIFLLLSGSRFVLMFELHDNSLKGFVDTAIISSFSPPFASSLSKRYVPDDGFVCISLSWFLLFASASIRHRCIARLHFRRVLVHFFWLPDKFSSSLSSAFTIHYPDSSLSSSAFSLKDFFFFLSVFCMSISSGIFSTNVSIPSTLSISLSSN